VPLAVRRAVLSVVAIALQLFAASVAHAAEKSAQFDIVSRSGVPPKSEKFEETVAVLLALSGAPTKLVESVMNNARPDSDFALILAKAAGLSWPTVKHICILRRKVFRFSPQAIENARHSFDRLQTTTAQRLLRFYNERHAALADFHQLEQQICA